MMKLKIYARLFVRLCYLKIVGCGIAAIFGVMSYELWECYN